MLYPVGLSLYCLCMLFTLLKRMHDEDTLLFLECLYPCLFRHVRGLSQVGLHTPVDVLSNADRAYRVVSWVNQGVHRVYCLLPVFIGLYQRGSWKCCEQLMGCLPLTFPLRGESVSQTALCRNGCNEEP